jgi:hypothetical protein
VGSPDGSTERGVGGYAEEEMSGGLGMIWAEGGRPAISGCSLEFDDDAVGRLRPDEAVAPASMGDNGRWVDRKGPCASSPVRDDEG